MGQEIERKFLVKGEFPRTNPVTMAQAYLSSDPSSTVRVRLAGDIAWLTIKGKSSGISRAEFEYEIPVSDAKELIELATSSTIEKTRYHIASGPHTWEIDVFEGENHGLIIAEIELNSEDEEFEKPDWLGEDVSHDFRYSNSSLAKNSYKSWSS